jgi:hypothetical protein
MVVRILPLTTRLPRVPLATRESDGVPMESK